MSSFSFGIEHEVAFIRPDGSLADFRNTRAEEFQEIIDSLPEYGEDGHSLRQGDLGIRRKRWYIEGYERFDLQGNFVRLIPKGIEIRTTIQPSIAAALDELRQSYQLLVAAAGARGFRPTLVSYHPLLTEFIPDPPLNAFELAQQRQDAPEEESTAHIPMLTYGPDLSLSRPGLPDQELVDAACKLTWYSPGLVPFSFSSPFWAGKRWDGLSVRTFYRTGPRPAVLVFPADRELLRSTNPSLTKAPRHPAEAGRLEFKAFDSCADFSLYASLLALLKGLVLDTSLPGRAWVPDLALHQLAARRGFAAAKIDAMAAQALTAARQALADDADCQLLMPLISMHQHKLTPAHQLLALGEDAQKNL